MLVYAPPPPDACPNFLKSSSRRLVLCAFLREIYEVFEFLETSEAWLVETVLTFVNKFVRQQITSAVDLQNKEIFFPFQHEAPDFFRSQIPPCPSTTALVLTMFSSSYQRREVLVNQTWVFFSVLPRAVFFQDFSNIMQAWKIHKSFHEKISSMLITRRGQPWQG